MITKPLGVLALLDGGVEFVSMLCYSDDTALMCYYSDDSVMISVMPLKKKFY